jgi:regulator of protease activity HflC (stomatin/prohibitin superfamily)
MIGLITFILVLAILSLVMKLFTQNYYREPDKWGDRKIKTSSASKVVIALFISTLCGLFNPLSIDRVDSGKVAILVDNIGDNKGMAKVEYKRGWVLYNTFSQQYYEFPVYQQHIDYEENTIITKGGFQVTIKPSFNYALNPTTVDQMFQNLRVDIKAVEQGWLRNAIISSVNDVANLYTVDEIFNHRAEFETSIITECNKRVGKWFTVSQLRTNITPPPAITKAIEDKTKAVQEAQAAIQRKEVAEAEAQEKIARAKGDSAQAVISAAGEANAIKLKQLSLTPEYIEYIRVEKWNGAYPTTMLGNSPNVIFGIK